jgi:NitT/TauT family transport system permease protein
MTSSAKSSGGIAHKYGPVLTVVAAIFVIWYAGAVYLNAPFQLDIYKRAKQTDWSASQRWCLESGGNWIAA